MFEWKIVFWTPEEIAVELPKAVKEGWQIAHAPSTVPAVSREGQEIIAVMVTLAKRIEPTPTKPVESLPMKMRG